MAPPAAADDRLLIDNSNLTELKLTADEAVERTLTRTFQSKNSSSSSKESNNSSSSNGAASLSPSAAQAWKASHFHTDLRLVLGYTASILMIAVGVWSYFIEKEWSVNKGPTAIAVAIYLVLASIQTGDAYMQGNRIFYGSRKNVTSGKTERLVLSSSPLARHKLVPKSGSASIKGNSVPPEYVLDAEYSVSGKGQPKKGKVSLGTFADFVTEEGEFVESIFEERLRSGLAKLVGE
ncbi:hypothetical protein OC846_000584 [Tilletia horrida]|uniref:Signal peptidase complex subunit 2 n=1 Tax=Tilletia horrida TaxID=155126 RepID=A0AAN6GXQ5_9BASI|nr:hypothetical protein OC846_000584 [Tilletia horrida]